MSDYTFVDDYLDVIDTIAATDLAGVDTEFLRESTFLAQLCLLQFADRQTIFCIDPLKPHDYDRLWQVACDTRWVLHAGRQDIEVVYQTGGRMPRELFDTQIGAGLLGYAPQMGYARLVAELFDVDLPKSHTRADWSQRPLPDELLQYAADDVAHLLPAFDLLGERLDKAGRLAWAVEDSAALLDPALYDIRPQDALQRLKGARNLRGQQRLAAQALAEWRERRALDRNRPRQWILRDGPLLEIAVRQPKNMAGLKRIDGLSPKTADRIGRELIAVLDSVRDADCDYRPPRPPNESQKKGIKLLQSTVDGRARELGIAAEILAPKRELSHAVIDGDTSGRVFAGWRRDVVGERLIDALG